MNGRYSDALDVMPTEYRVMVGEGPLSTSYIADASLALGQGRLSIGMTARGIGSPALWLQHVQRMRQVVSSGQLILVPPPTQRSDQCDAGHQPVLLHRQLRLLIR